MKKTINLKFTITFLTIFAAMLALCFSSFAFAGQNENPEPGPEPEPVPVVDKGKILINAIGYSDLGDIYYKLDGQEEVKMNTSSTVLDSSSIGTSLKIYFRIVPKNNYRIDKELTKVSDGSQFIDVN